VATLLEAIFKLLRAIAEITEVKKESSIGSLF
jgi:hypothetical protein